MSVRKEERKVGKLDVAIQARNLAVYTLHITSNSSQFDESKGKELMTKIREISVQIYTKVWAANNVLVKTSKDKDYRLQLQKEACICCNELLPLLDIACKLFHQPTKRLAYWSEKVITVRNSIKAWYRSDSARYSEL